MQNLKESKIEHYSLLNITPFLMKKRRKKNDAFKQNMKHKSATPPLKLIQTLHIVKKISCESHKGRELCCF